MPIVTEIALTFWPIKKSWTFFVIKKVKYSGRKKTCIEKVFQHKKVFFHQYPLISFTFYRSTKKMWEGALPRYVTKIP